MNKTALDDLNSYVSKSELRLLSIYSWTSLLDIITYFLPLTFFLVNYELNRNRIFQALIYVFILLAVVILNKARTSMIPAILVLFIIRATYHAKGSATAMNRVIAIIFIVFTIYAAFTNIPLFNRILQDRILETSNVDKESRTMNTRVLAFQAFAECFPDQPILGAGNTKYASGSKGLWNSKLTNILAGRSAQIHVGFLSLFYLYGLVGGLMYSIFYIYAARKLYLKSKKYNFPAVFWGFMTLAVANIGLVSFNIMSAGLLLSFVLYRNLEVFCESPESRPNNKRPASNTPIPLELAPPSPQVAGITTPV